jgi:hypothetical protein
MGNDFPEDYGGHCGGFLVSSGENLIHTRKVAVKTRRLVDI